MAPTLPSASVSMCSQAPRMFRLSSLPPCSTSRPITFTASPPAAIHITVSPITGSGA